MTSYSEYAVVMLACIARIVAVVGALYLPQAFAGNSNFDKGLAAYTAGDMATAHQIWQPLAERSDAAAQFAEEEGSVVGAGAEAVFLHRLESRSPDRADPFLLALAHHPDRLVERHEVADVE